MVPILALISRHWQGLGLPFAILPAFFLLPASSTRLVLVDETYHLPPHEWRWVEHAELVLRQTPVAVLGEYDAQPDSSRVRLALMRREDMRRLNRGESHGVIALTPPGAAGRIVHTVHTPGDYVVVVDNREGERAASGHLRISLDFNRRHGPEVTYLSPERRLTVILISFAAFIGIVTWSARKLLRAIR